MRSVYKIKKTKIRDFIDNHGKLGFKYLDSMRVYEHEKDFKNGRLWVYPTDYHLEATYFKDCVRGNDSIIKYLTSQGYVETHYEN